MITAALVTSAAADSLTWGYYNGSQSLLSWGTGKAETYSMMMQVDLSSFVGAQITGVRLPLNCGTVSDANVYLSLEAPVAKSGKASGDVLNQAFTPALGWNTITFDQPYTIQSAMLYAGVTFKVDAIGEGDGSGYPLTMIADGTENSCSVVTSRTYRKWTDLAESLGASMPMQFLLEGENICPELAVSVSRLLDMSVKRGENYPVECEITNHGQQAVTSVDWTFQVGDQTQTGTSQINIDNQFFGQSAKLSFTTPVIDQTGEYQGTLTITKVNGQDNADQGASRTANVRVMNIVPNKLPILEEFTGCWCGWCTRGWLGLRLMNEAYPGEFIAAAYHNGDAMEVCSDSDFPVKIGGYPGANIDRCHDCDPYLGDSNSDPLGIDKVWNNMKKATVPPANVAVEATLNDDATQIELTASYQFCMDVAEASYGVAYIVTADGLKGADKNWLQHNYYAGDASYCDGLLDELVAMASNTLLVYDDVVVAQSHTRGESYTDVIPASLVESQVVEHSSSFQLAQMVGTYGDNLVQNKSKLNVIAMLIDTNTGAVLNAAKCHVINPEDAGIQHLQTEAQVLDSYSIDGRRQHDKATGFSILRMNDGSSRKALIK